MEIMHHLTPSVFLKTKKNRQEGEDEDDKQTPVQEHLHLVQIL